MNYAYVNIIITTTWCPSIDFYEMRLRLLTAATNGHTVHPPDDMSFDSDGGMISTGENQRTRRKTCLNATWTDPGMNLGLPGERPATNRPSHGTDLTQSFSSHVTTSYRFYCSKPWLTASSNIDFLQFIIITIMSMGWDLRLRTAATNGLLFLHWVICERGGLWWWYRLSNTPDPTTITGNPTSRDIWE
jgi:hypothetical protein